MPPDIRAGAKEVVLGNLQVLQQDSTGELSASAGASMECRLDGSASPSVAWSPCDGAVSYDKLQDGNQAFAARVAGSTNTQTMAQSNFTVDTAAPVTQARTCAQPIKIAQR